MTACLSFMTDTYRFMTLTKCGVLGLCRRCRTLHRSGWTLPGQWCVTTCRKHGAKDAQGSLYSRDPAYHTICPLPLTSQHVKHPHTMDAVTPSVHNEHWASQMAPVCWAFNKKKLSQGVTSVTSRHEINSRRHENADFRDERVLGTQNRTFFLIRNTHVRL